MTAEPQAKSSNRLAAAILVGFSTCLVYSTAAHPQSLEYFAKKAIQHNPTIVGEQFQLEEDAEAVIQAKANRYPTVQATAGYGFAQDLIKSGSAVNTGTYPTQYPSKSIGLNATQSIFRGGRTQAEVREAVANVDGEKAHLQSVKQAILIQVIIDYLSIANDEAAVSTWSDAKAAYQQDLIGARRQLELGSGDKLDVAQAEALLLQAGAQLGQAQVRLDAARADMKKDSGEECRSAELTQPQAFLNQDREAFVSRAISDNPDIRSAEEAVRAARQNLRDKEGQRYPSMSVQGAILGQESNTRPVESETVKSITFQMSLPIFSGGLISSQIRQARDDVGLKEAQLFAERDTVSDQVRTAVQTVDEEKRLLAVANAEVTAYSLAIVGLTKQHQGGVKSLFDVLAGRQLLFQAQLQRAQVRHDLALAMYSTLDACGELQDAL